MNKLSGCDCDVHGNNAKVEVRMQKILYVALIHLDFIC